jgi:four helix bundle protein
MTTSMKDLKVWQESVGLGGDVVRAMRVGTRREVKVVSDQIMQTAVAVATQVADGYACYGVAEQRDLFRAARRSLSVLETQLAVARQGGLIPATTLAQLSTRIGTVGRLLHGYVLFIERQLEAAAASPGPNAGASAPAGAAAALSH